MIHKFSKIFDLDFNMGFWSWVWHEFLVLNLIWVFDLEFDMGFWSWL